MRLSWCLLTDIRGPHLSVQSNREEPWNVDHSDEQSTQFIKLLKKWEKNLSFLFSTIDGVPDKDKNSIKKFHQKILSLQMMMMMMMMIDALYLSQEVRLDFQLPWLWAKTILTVKAPAQLTFCHLVESTTASVLFSVTRLLQFMWVICIRRWYKFEIITSCTTSSGKVQNSSLVLWRAKGTVEPRLGYCYFLIHSCMLAIVSSFGIVQIPSVPLSTTLLRAWDWTLSLNFNG